MMFVIARYYYSGISHDVILFHISILSPTLTLSLERVHISDATMETFILTLLPYNNL
jgi:hypothetical protein